jgi:hypothetical protein
VDGENQPRRGVFQTGTMTIKGSTTKELKNILVGEVWICSGQSNMQFNVGSSTMLIW